MLCLSRSKNKSKKDKSNSNINSTKKKIKSKPKSKSKKPIESLRLPKNNENSIWQLQKSKILNPYYNVTDLTSSPGATIWDLYTISEKLWPHNYLFRIYLEASACRFDQKRQIQQKKHQLFLIQKQIMQRQLEIDRLRLEQAYNRPSSTGNPRIGRKLANHVLYKSKTPEKLEKSKTRKRRTSEDSKNECNNSGSENEYQPPKTKNCLNSTQLSIPSEFRSYGTSPISLDFSNKESIDNYNDEVSNSSLPSLVTAPNLQLHSLLVLVVVLKFVQLFSLHFQISNQA